MKSRTISDRSKQIRSAINWWNTLSIPQRDQIRRFCYPEKTTVFVYDNEKVEMHSLSRKIPQLTTINNNN